MISVTSAELAQYREEMTDVPMVLRVLDVIEDCEGDLEDAAITIALKVGQEPERSEKWLDGLAKRWRVQICDPALQTELQAGRIGAAVRSLTSETTIPAPLAVLVVIYALKQGIASFCQPLMEKL
jgi:hypothetical protein